MGAESEAVLPRDICDDFIERLYACACGAPRSSYTGWPATTAAATNPALYEIINVKKKLSFF